MFDGGDWVQILRSLEHDSTYVARYIKGKAESFMRIGDRYAGGNVMNEGTSLLEAMMARLPTRTKPETLKHHVDWYEDMFDKITTLLDVEHYRGSVQLEFEF